MKIRTTTLSLVIFLAIGSLALCPASTALGVVPAPDGGYPGSNTAEGQNALFSLTSGTFNTAVGFLSLKSNTDGAGNTATGDSALLSNIDGVSNRHRKLNTA